jgi:transcriptional regulator with XRE-family HTH domain
MKRPLNLVGPQVRKLRDQKNWTQDLLAQKLQLTGWDVSRTSLAKLEAQLRWVSDVEILFLARVLGVDINLLYPKRVDLRTVGPQFR